MKKSLLILSMIVLSLTSCKEMFSLWNEPDFIFNEFQSELMYANENGDTLSVSFISARKWNIVLDADEEMWVKVSPNRGEAGDNTVKIFIDANDAKEIRFCTLNFLSGDYSEDLRIQQDPR